MTPTPAQIARLLKLPLAARQRLITGDGPGWWISPVGAPYLKPYPSLDGGAWFPADSAAWTQAAFGERWYDTILAEWMRTILADPIDAALSELEAAP